MGRPKKINQEQEVDNVNEREESKPEKQEIKIKYERLPKSKEDRKVLIRAKTLEIIKERYMHEKFNVRFFMDKTGTKGYIRQSVPYALPYDKKVFEEILLDLVKEEILYHIGGPLYKLRKKGQEL